MLPVINDFGSLMSEGRGNMYAAPTLGRSDALET
jgi:hypothetical protein